MYSRFHKKRDIHYVITETIKNVECWIHIFDYKNLMLYLLDSTQNIANKNIYYVDNLCRSYKSNNIYSSESHKLNLSELIKQAYDYEAKTLHKKVYNKLLDINEFPSRKWNDLYRSLPIHESEWCYSNRWGYHLPYSNHSHKSHKQCSFGVPKTMWRKVRFNHNLATICDDYDDDFSPYLTNKTRYSKSSMLGWWDDYTRRKKSTGWKESSKRKHQWKVKNERES